MPSWRPCRLRLTVAAGLGRVQPVGRAPGPPTAADTAEYWAGAFLLAAEQVLALASD